MRTAFLLVLLVLAGACGTGRHAPFGFRYSHYRGESIDTFAGTVTKDMVRLPDTTIALVFTPMELAEVRRAVDRARFDELPDTIWYGRTVADASGPEPLMQIEIQYGRERKSVTVDGSYRKERITPRSGDEFRRVVAIVNAARGILKKRPEYQALPPARGGYL